MSSLQGRPMQAAAEELLSLGENASLGPIGLQLTPGCAPTDGFEAWLRDFGVTTRSHHGFSWSALRRPVWSVDANLLTDDQSVHPPRLTDPAAGRFWDVASRNNVAYETMYPGYALGRGYDLERAMDLGLDLAVDVSHLYIQRSQLAVNDAVLDRVFRYERIIEVHVSDNDGRSDQHKSISANTFALDWVLEKLANGTSVIVESYLHRLPLTTRIEMFALFGKSNSTRSAFNPHANLNGAFR